MAVKSHQSAAGLVVGLLVTCVLIIFVFLMMYRRKKQKSNRQKTAMIEFAHINKQPERSPSMEELDFEDILEDVELL